MFIAHQEALSMMQHLRASAVVLQIEAGLSRLVPGASRRSVCRAGNWPTGRCSSMAGHGARTDELKYRPLLQANSSINIQFASRVMAAVCAARTRRMESKHDKEQLSSPPPGTGVGKAYRGCAHKTKARPWPATVIDEAVKSAGIAQGEVEDVGGEGCACSRGRTMVMKSPRKGRSARPDGDSCRTHWTANAPRSRQRFAVAAPSVMHDGGEIAIGGGIES